MASLSEHATAIKAAIQAAEDDGYIIEFETDITRDDRDLYATMDIVHHKWVTHENGMMQLTIYDWEELYAEERGRDQGV